MQCYMSSGPIFLSGWRKPSNPLASMLHGMENTYKTAPVFSSLQPGVKDDAAVLEKLYELPLAQKFLKENHITSIQGIQASLHTLLGPKTVLAWQEIASGLRHVDQRHWPLAEKIYHSILNNRSLPLVEKPWALLGLAKISHRRNNNLQACHYLDKALKIPPGNHYDVLDYYANLLSLKFLNPQKAISLYCQLLEIAQKTKNKFFEAKAHLGLGNARHGSGIEHYRSALKIAQEIGDSFLQAKVHLALGHIADGNRVEHYQRALTFAKEIKHLPMQAQAYIALGNLATGQEIEYFRKALAIAEQIRDLTIQAQAHLGLGNAGEGNRFEHYFTALKLGERINSFVLQAQAYLGLGNMKHGTPIEHYQNALQRAEKIGHLYLQTQAKVGLGNAYSANQDNKTALKYYQEAFQLAPTPQLKQKAQAGIARVQRFLNPNRILKSS